MKYKIGKHPNSRKSTPFIKGHKQLNTGRTHFKKGMIPWNLGIKQWANKPNPNWKGGKIELTCKSCGKKYKNYRSANSKYCSQMCHLITLGKERSGEKNNMWKGGITPINAAIRTSREYKLWRIAVFERDNYTCIWCGRKEVTLHADHIKPFAYFPELRFAIDNGRTLCVPCHKTTDTYMGKAKRSIKE
jgi:5-methylcytosine-specific restriction endonuclease McrA